MAESVVSFLLEHLSTLLREEAELLGGLRQDVQEIKDELEQMMAFLRFAESKEEEDDPRFQEWVRQVREAAYDTEDILDDFMFHFARNRRDGFYGSISRSFSKIKKLRTRHKFASQIQQMKKRTNGIFERKQRYQSEYGTAPQVPENNVAPRMWRSNKDDALLVEESKLVGIDGPKKQLISQLLDSDPQIKVVSVVGMGGLGKTTLVRRVYEDLQIRSDFQMRAWITVSSQSRSEIEDLLRDLIQQLYNESKQPAPEEIKSMRSDELKRFLKHFLKDKRYLIVFDDVWDIEFWNNIKFALPECSCGNRVMITTRIADVAAAPCIESHGYVHKMETLPADDSWTLFCRKTFEDQCCPNHLRKVCENILGKCEGLPLAIVAISGFLALKNKNNLMQWEIVQHSLGAELEGSGKLDRIKRILSLSYNELPYYLKTCLTYVSIFPEDYQISSHRLTRLWISERFVEGKRGMTVEDVAGDYLMELINRSLIQVTDVWYNGEPKTCRIHDLLREILFSKSRDLSIMTVATGQQHMRWPEKVRRLVIHSCHDSTPDFNCCKHLRSLITFGSVDLVSKSLISDILSGGSRLLKTLDLESAKLEEIPDEVFNLFHLRLLFLGKTRVKIVPKDIGKLVNLEYLDLVDTEVKELPEEILKLQRLKEINLYSLGDYLDNYCSYGFQAPYKIGALISLRELHMIHADTDKIIVTEIGKLTQLRELSIGKLRREDGMELCSSLGKLKNLVYLHVSSVERDEIIDLESHCLSSSLQFLQFLSLEGRIERVPRWIPSLQGLTKLELFWSELKDDPLESLQHLPNLLHLILSQAYQGEGLCFKAGGFLKLEILSIIRSSRLRWMKVEEGSMPHLNEIILTGLELLDELPLGIQHLNELKFVDLSDMSDNLIAKLGNRNEESEEYRKIAHVPEVIIAHWGQEGWEVSRASLST